MEDQEHINEGYVYNNPHTFENGVFILKSSPSFRPRPKHYTLWLDSRLPHRQTTSGENGLVHLQLHHPERRSPAGLCPESPALLSLHTRLCVLSQLHFYC